MDQVWGSSRPARPKEPVKVLGIQFTGKRFEDKLADLRKELEKKKSLGFVVCEFSLTILSPSFRSNYPGD